MTRIMVDQAESDDRPKLVREPHPHCIVCSKDNDKGLGLAFSLFGDGRVEADFHSETWHQGYPGILHGGVVSAVLDGAMTNCLFAHGHLGMTGELNVRFRHPVAVGEDSVVSAWIEKCHPPYHLVKAELVQNGKVMARATGKFVDAPVEIAT
jgi:acyl-coenzyme A thioesterase PaaI-like protein